MTNDHNDNNNDDSYKNEAFAKMYVMIETMVITIMVKSVKGGELR